MKICFRVDSAREIGTGHVRRCLNLASLLRRAGKFVYFITRQFEGNIAEEIQRQGFLCKYLPLDNAYVIDKNDYGTWLGVNYQVDLQNTIDNLEKNTDWLIVDHYAIEEKWEKGVAPFVKKIMVIDDLANRKHYCDIFIDQNIRLDPKKDYEKLIPKKTICFFGPEYALLHTKFLECVPCTRPKRNIDNLFVFLGGIDLENITLKIIQSIKDLDFRGNTHIVITRFNPFLSMIKDFVSEMRNAHLYIDLESLYSVMSQCDAGICAGGVNALERLYLCLPTLTIPTAPNQIEQLDSLQSSGCSVVIDQGINSNSFTEQIDNFIKNHHLRKKIHLNNMNLAPKSKLQKIILSMKALVNYKGLEPFSLQYVPQLFYERNLKQTRCHMDRTDIISLDDHLSWSSRTLVSGDNIILIYRDVMPCGYMNLYNFDKNLGCTWGFYVFPSKYGKKFGRSMCEKTILLCQNILNLKKIYASIHENNINSKRLHESLGFYQIKDNEYIKEI